jgi:hypothetical protein
MPPERDRDQGDHDLNEERETLVALKNILLKVAQLLRPLGLTPEESTTLVERLYESVLDLDVKLAGEPDETRRARMVDVVQQATVRREDGELVIDYPR